MEAIEDITGLLIWATWISWGLSIASYVYFAVCLQVIANKTDTKNGWLAWIPIANVYLMCKIAEKPWWWLLLCLIPIANVVFMVILWMNIAEARDKKRWLGILMIVPIANYVVPGHLAFSGGASRVSEAEIQTNFAAPGRLAYAGGATAVGGVGTPPGWLREMEVQTRKGAEEARQAVPYIEPEVRGKSVRLVMPPSTGFKQIAQFQEHLKEVEGVTIRMAGGSADEGSIITVSVQKETDLIPILNEMPMVDNARGKGGDIMVKLRSLGAGEDSPA